MISRIAVYAAFAFCMASVNVRAVEPEFTPLEIDEAPFFFVEDSLKAASASTKQKEMILAPAVTQNVPSDFACIYNSVNLQFNWNLVCFNEMLR